MDATEQELRFRAFLAEHESLCMDDEDDRNALAKALVSVAFCTGDALAAAIAAWRAVAQASDVGMLLAENATITGSAEAAAVLDAAATFTE